MLSSNRLVSAFKPWEPVSKDGHIVENAVEHGESSPLKCNTEGRATASLNFKDPIEDTTPGIDEQTSLVTTPMKRTKQTRLGSNDKHLKPSKNLEAGITSDDPSLSNEGKSNELSSPSVGQSGGCNSQKAITSDQSFNKTENLSHGKKMHDKDKEGVERPMMNSARKGRLTADFRGVEALPQGATGGLTEITTPDVVEKEHVTKDMPIPVVVGLQCSTMTVTQSKKLKRLPREDPLNIAEAEKRPSSVPLSPKTTGNVEGKEVDADVIPKRKRGRPPKSQAKIPKTSLAADHQNGDAVQGAVLVEGSERNASGSAISVGTESGKENPVHEKEQLQLTGSHNTPKQKNASKSVDDRVVNVDKLPNESSGKALAVQHKYKLVKGKRGKRRTISSINIESSAQDGQDSSKQTANGVLEKDSTAGNSEPPVEKSLDTVSDDQPLSRWFEGMHSSTTVDSTVAAPQRRVEQSSEPSKKQFENPKFSPAVANGDMVAGDGQTLPFVKTSSLWQAIELMELFRKIPQNPHFRSLNSLKESVREGQAICQMVNFSKVVEETSQLRFHHPRSAIEERLETLVELESHGFNVKLVRNRLTRLLLIKDKQEELEARSKEVGDKIEQETVERRGMDTEIELLDEQIRELLERRTQLMSKKQKKASEVAAWEAEVDGIKEGMDEIRREFDDLAAASL